MSTLDWGMHISGGGLPSTYAETTHAFQVDGGVVGNLHLILDKYTSPQGEVLNGVLYRAPRSGGTAAPTAGWVPVDTSIAGAATLAASDTQFVAANLPGTYTLHWESDGAAQGTDDNPKSAPITMTVFDVPGAAGATPTYVNDDWVPKVTATPTAVIGDSTTARVLTGLTPTDARGSDAGTGVLAAATTRLLEFRLLGTDNTSPAVWWNSLATQIAWYAPTAFVMPDGTACRVSGPTCPAAQHVAVNDGVTPLTGTITYQVAIVPDNAVASSSAQTAVVKAIVGQIGLDVTPNSGTAPLTVTVSGVTPDKGRVVTVKGDDGSSKTVASDALTGAFSTTFTISKTTVFSASSLNSVSPEVTATITTPSTPPVVIQSSVVKFSVSVSGKKVKITATGGPVGGGQFSVLRDDEEVASAKASAKGTISVVLNGQKKGTHIYAVVYTAPGADPSDPAEKAVKIK